MSQYTINSECGVNVIEAESVEAAKAEYSAEKHFDFDAVDTILGSWYAIFDEHGDTVESGGDVANAWH